MQQIVNFYNNHGLFSKEEEDSPLKIGKKWSARLVTDHLYHNEIEEEVQSLGDLAPNVRITEWAKVVTKMHDSLPKEVQRKHEVLAKQWKAEGPPMEVRMRFVSYI